MKTAQPLSITQTIHSGACVIHVHGLRSRKGWNISRVDDGTERHQGDRKLKAEAIQFAEDACEPGVATTFHVKPRP